MDTLSIMSQLNEIFIEELDEKDIQLQSDTTANDVENWDSLSHIALIVAIEKHFKIKFTAMEIQKFKNVGELCESIRTKLNK